MKFTEGTTTDAKRLARGEHWRMAQIHFRRQQYKHHPSVRVVTLAGGNPREEIECIRSLLPRAEIVAVDRDQQCCEAARDAGADAVLCADLFDWGDRGRVPQQIRDLGRIDVVNLDLCGGITRDVELAVARYGRLVKRTGMLMLTFSYGRDVTELFSRDPWRGIPAPLAGRVRRLDAHIPSRLDYSVRPEEYVDMLGLTSVIAYKGAMMPMCSCLWEGDNNPDEPAFVNVTDDDLMYAVLTQLDPVDVSRLYAVPSDRIEHFRRKAAAARAVTTRQSRGA